MSARPVRATTARMGPVLELNRPAAVDLPQDRVAVGLRHPGRSGRLRLRRGGRLDRGSANGPSGGRIASFTRAGGRTPLAEQPDARVGLAALDSDRLAELGDVISEPSQADRSHVAPPCTRTVPHGTIWYQLVGLSGGAGHSYGSRPPRTLLAGGEGWSEISVRAPLCEPRATTTSDEPPTSEASSSDDRGPGRPGRANGASIERA